MSEIWLDGKKHTPPVGVIIEALWAAPNDDDDMPVKGWLRHDVLRGPSGGYLLVGPSGKAVGSDPDFWRLQVDVPPPRMQG